MSAAGEWSADEWAAERFGWFTALLGAGFTRDEAIQVLAATISIQTQGQSPEVSEAMSKMSALINRELSEGA